MIKKITLSFFVAFACVPAFACEICGCFMGITPYDNQSSFALMHRYRVFSGYQSLGGGSYFPKNSDTFFPGHLNSKGSSHQHGPNGEELTTHPNTDYELFRTLELRAKYFIHRRIELNAFVPYNMNSTSYNGSVSNISGVGDINVFAGYHAIRQIETAGLQHRLIVGAGVKLPTGNYYRKDAEGNRYPLLNQPGTGSTDYFVYANYITGYKAWGLNINSSYKINGENYYYEGIANSTANFANLFYRMAPGVNWKVVASVQGFYEFTKGETLGGQPTNTHRMDNALLGPGIDIFYKNIGANLSMQFPVYEGKTTHPESNGRLILGLSYNLNQMKYLF